MAGCELWPAGETTNAPQRSLRSKYNTERNEEKKEKPQQSSKVSTSMGTHERLKHLFLSVASGRPITKLHYSFFLFHSVASVMPESCCDSAVDFCHFCTPLHCCSARSSSTFFPSSDINFHILFPQQEINTACKYRSFAFFFLRVP